MYSFLTFENLTEWKEFPNYLSLGVELKTSSSLRTVFFFFFFSLHFLKYLKCFNLIFILYWNIFDLQSCIAFRCIAK